MRMTSMLAGLGVLFAACSGEKKGPDSQATTTPDQQQPAPAAGGAGKTHDVNMVLQGTSYKYVPDKLTVGQNDVVRYHMKSGPPHNVAFWPDSIPQGAASAIALTEPLTGTLSSKLAIAPDEVIELKLNNAPKGEYKYFCTPHAAMGMKASLTVQ